ncbi:flippase-like domain-containing protein [Streptomyces sp. ISL-1]|uniref:lysylphosphatidylglycerol synthase transmembrane domain-containing protein n=1 Tax=Streptomyces sp. ISL-1 TaxID=2817657 RepID=UPI001BE906FD|nr:lysylphosphatidylglycerol synthase domain-containing protein [Streptomyces sp. ISL-1]MBT2388565.1 flippase-like domain-containing protein [Streptomyces sp. ISL-1]
MSTPHANPLRGLPLRQIACLMPIAAVALWAARHWPLITAGGSELLSANQRWLLVAATLTVLGWVAVSFTRQGATVEPLPAVRLFVTQFAAGAANHLLPAGLGAGAVNLRFLQRRGLPLSRCSAALALHMLAASTGRIALLLALLAVSPNALRLDSLMPDAAGPLLLLVVGCPVCVVAVALGTARRLRRAIRAFADTALSDARSVHSRPTRVLALWGGALAYPTIQAAVLVAVAMALEVSVPMVHIGIAYLAGSTLASAVPTPGGIGSVDAALVIALVTTGVSIAMATSVVLGYRIITVWLPLVPGALVLGVLVRSKVI